MPLRATLSCSQGGRLSGTAATGREELLTEATEQWLPDPALSEWYWELLPENSLEPEAHAHSQILSCPNY